MEIGNILGPCATLLAVSLAIFVFTLPRSLSIYNEKTLAVGEVDVPDYIKKRGLFRFFVFGDSMLLFLAGIQSLILGIFFVIIMSHILDLYLGSPLVTVNRILNEFKFLLLVLIIIIFILLAASVALFTTEVLIAEKKLPLLARVYARRVLGRSSSKSEVDSLWPEARSMYEKDAFGDAVLHSVATLELALKDRLNLPEGVGFGRLMGSVREKLEGIIPVSELIEIRRVRNNAAHPSPERRVTKQDAERVLSLVEDILGRLQADSTEGFN